MQKRIPENIDPHEALKIKAADPINPTNTVLLQEISRYNNLLNSIRKSLTELQKVFGGGGLRKGVEGKKSVLFPFLWLEVYFFSQMYANCA